MQLTITEEELTSYLMLNTTSTPLREGTAWFTSDGLLLRLRLDILGSHMLHAALAIGCERGTLRITGLRATLNGHCLPRLLLASLQQAINDALHDAHYPLQVQQVVAQEGMLLIVGVSE